MDRSVYSLVLMDKVVEAIDRQAYQNNTSRSALINKILAQYVSCVTPEQRIEDIFSQMRKMIEEAEVLQILPQVSDLQIGMRSALQYRYNPIIQYSVVLYRQMEPYFGVLRINSRTQSKPLMTALSDFYVVWSEVESDLASFSFENGVIPYALESGRFSRELRFPKEATGLTNELLAEVVLNYIRTFDAALKWFLASSEPYEAVKNEIEKIYASALLKQHFIV